jgi:acyl-CoA thioesterase FadM
MKGASIQFKAPITFPDTISIGSYSEKVSDTEFITRNAIVSHKSGRVVAEIENGIVWVNYTTGKRTAFSPEIEAKLGFS